MDEPFYVRFLAEQQAGLRGQAKITIREFVRSFADSAERERWTRQFLSTLPPGEVVRHELYEEIIFPVLLAGYERRDAWSLYWLAETEQNRLKAQHLDRVIGGRSRLDLLREAYGLASSSAEIQHGLLRELLRRFQYISHEWPMGLVYDSDRPWQTQYWEVLGDIRLARELDRSGAHAKEIADIEEMVITDHDRKRR